MNWWFFWLGPIISIPIHSTEQYVQSIAWIENALKQNQFKVLARGVIKFRKHGDAVLVKLMYG
jgi:hypothetical protein